MMPDEKKQLLEFFEHERRWCREAEAQDANGESVRYDDEQAVAWDIAGGLCRLFGWPRAVVLFSQLDRHIHGKRGAISWPARDADMESMSALQEFNDHPETTFAMLREHLESITVWRGPADGTVPD